MKKYQIWDKACNVITPTMEVFTPEQWIERYPAARIEGIDLVIAAGVLNGAFCQEYTSFVEIYKKAGCDFTDCTTREEYITRICEFEEQMEAARAEAAKVAANTPSPEERVAAALEAQVMMAMPDNA